MGSDFYFIIQSTLMKKQVYYLIFAFCFLSSVYAQKNTSNVFNVSLDLKNIKDDQVEVVMQTPAFTEENIHFYIPKIIPGTYSEDNYGKYVESLKAFDKNGKSLSVVKIDENTWNIKNAKSIRKISYRVNDTFDIEDVHDIFSPAGTNIEANQNFLINPHGFFGYFEGKANIPYNLTISHPKELYASTSLFDLDPNEEIATYKVDRYAQLVDNPIMFSKPDYTSFVVDGMEILISVYSPNGTYTAESITPEMKKMMTAQKKFLGSFNNTKKYSIILYLSDLQKSDAQGFGALEHNTSTVVILPEMMPKEELLQAMIDVVSHEFFHIVTPLNIHSEEIQNFDFNKPKMSEHLWMYEGVTEYFANLFQVNQGLITEEDFYKRMSDKIKSSTKFDDTMNFTNMSKNILNKPYKDAYYNVYLKGALIAMCLDIQIRESSQGERGILDLMQKLSTEYGNEKPFKDSELFAKIEALTYPAVGEFLKTYVSGTTPIPYDAFFAKMGVSTSQSTENSNPFFNGNTPYITANQETKEIIFLTDTDLPIFMTSLGIEGGDILLEINQITYNIDNAYDLIESSMEWKEDEAITVKVKRDGIVKVLKGKVKLPKEEITLLTATDDSKKALKEAWLWH